MGFDEALEEPTRAGWIGTGLEGGEAEALGITGSEVFAEASAFDEGVDGFVGMVLGFGDQTVDVFVASGEIGAEARGEWVRAGLENGIRIGLKFAQKSGKAAVGGRGCLVGEFGGAKEHDGMIIGIQRSIGAKGAEFVRVSEVVSEKADRIGGGKALDRGFHNVRSESLLDPIGGIARGFDCADEADDGSIDIEA